MLKSPTKDLMGQFSPIVYTSKGVYMTFIHPFCELQCWCDLCDHVYTYYSGSLQFHKFKTMLMQFSNYGKVQRCHISPATLYTELPQFLFYLWLLSCKSTLISLGFKVDIPFLSRTIPKECSSHPYIIHTFV